MFIQIYPILGILSIYRRKVPNNWSDLPRSLPWKDGVAALELSSSKIKAKFVEHSTKLDNLQSAINKIADRITPFDIQEPESNVKDEYQTLTKKPEQ